jgi:hypothetical protein
MGGDELAIDPAPARIELRPTGFLIGRAFDQKPAVLGTDDVKFGNLSVSAIGAGSGIPDGGSRPRTGASLRGASWMARPADCGSLASASKLQAATPAGSGSDEVAYPPAAGSSSAPKQSRIDRIILFWDIETVISKSSRSFCAAGTDREYGTGSIPG